MSNIENDPVLAAEISANLKSSSQSLSAPSTFQPTTSNGPAAKDIGTIIASSATVFSSFSSAVSKGAGNILKISQKYEEMDASARRKNSSGR